MLQVRIFVPRTSLQMPPPSPVPPPPPPPPLVLHPLLPSEFLEYLLTHLSSPTKTTLIVCSTRETFLHELLACVTSGSTRHALVVPTLHLISASRAVQLAFTPTLHHLRAYLSIFPRQKPPTAPDSSEFPTLALLNPISVHRSLPEFSAQGLSRTFAVAVDAAARSRMRLVVAECAEPNSAQEGDGGGVSKSVWDEQVPLLSGTVRGFGSEEKGWTGRTVKIKRVLERWCLFSEDKQDAAVP
ncbi:MAG: hypothetical protein M1840_000753 [Geoglossum simile]|nr:MAG: hypothetical protein M1840_000753 [Geoglossum simile]